LLDKVLLRIKNPDTATTAENWIAIPSRQISLLQMTNVSHLKRARYDLISLSIPAAAAWEYTHESIARIETCRSKFQRSNDDASRDTDADKQYDSVFHETS
jgi:DNA-binding FadR family transcriptional regulator